MKKVLFYFTSVLLIILIATTTVPVNATSATDLYTPANDGDLLYTVNMKGDTSWQPTMTQGSITITVIDEKAATLFADNNSAQNWYGGEIKGLPLNANTNYTIKYTVTRTETACFGLYFDGTYGGYGYSNQNRIMNKASGVAGHNYIKYLESGLDVPGVTNDGTPQNLAIEVNGEDCTFSLYIMDASGKYQYLDGTVKGEILAFATESINLYFYQYYSQHATVSNIEFYKGLTISQSETAENTVDETTKTPETTKAPETTKKPETTKTPETTKAPVTTVALTTKAPDTTAATESKSGCGSLISGSFGCMVISVAVAYCFKKSKE